MKNGAHLFPLLILIVLLIASPLCVSTQNPKSVQTTPIQPAASGWSMLQPRISTIGYNHITQTFSAEFDNQVGNRISITSTEVKEKISNASCAIMINGETIDTNPLVIENESVLKIEGFCDGKPKKAGESYQLEIELNYTALTGFINTENTEKGTINGEYD